MKKTDLQKVQARAAEYAKLREAGITPERKKRSAKMDFFMRFAKNRLALFGAALFIVMALIAFNADNFFDYESQAIFQNMSQRLLKPSAEHIFGTDEYGRDIFVRIVYGARISLFVGLGTVLSSMLLGCLIGAVAAYYGGKVDNLLMRTMDIFLAVPSSLMAICVVAALGTGIFKLMIALAISEVPRFSRVVRSSVLGTKGQEFIEAAKACGTRDLRIIIRHILPNSMGPIIVQATTNVARCVLMISSLSFIGLGIPSPTPEWGSMLSEGRTLMRYYPNLVIFPGIALMMTALSFYSIGDGLRDAMDPRLRN